MNGYIANTDYQWYEFLRARQNALEEVNFWQPSGTRRFRAVPPGSPFFFRLKSPHNAIAGFGYFARNVAKVPAWYAWEAFGENNGTATLDEMVRRIRHYRGMSADGDGSEVIGCVLVSQPMFFPPDAWVAQPAGWHPNVVQGMTIDLDSGEGARIMRECLANTTALADVESPGGLAAGSQAERYGKPVAVALRLGQRSFQLAVTDAYGSCAVTTEHSLPVLEAAHIRPYAEGGTHTVNNGLLLRRDIHRLFDKGYVAVARDHRFVVSKRLRREFDNGRTYYQLAGRQLHLPRRQEDRPDPEALEWHRDTVWSG